MSSTEEASQERIKSASWNRSSSHKELESAKSEVKDVDNLAKAILEGAKSGMEDVNFVKLRGTLLDGVSQDEKVGDLLLEIEEECRDEDCSFQDILNNPKAKEIIEKTAVGKKAIGILKETQEEILARPMSGSTGINMLEEWIKMETKTLKEPDLQMVPYLEKASSDDEQLKEYINEKVMPEIWGIDRNAVFGGSDRHKVVFREIR